jgi:3D (Asp-Asp-Asp) domain-containing protein
LGTGTPRPERKRLLLPGLSLVFTAALLALLLPLAARGAVQLRIKADGRLLTLPSNAETVREALAEARVALGPDDEVTPPLDAPVPPDGAIQVARVAFEEGTLDQKVPYKTIVRPPAPGKRPYHPTVVREGANGLQRLTYRIKRVDGREVQRSTVSQVWVKEPVSEIVISRNPSALGARGAYAGKRVLNVVATAYDPGPGSCGKWADGKTCNGKRAGYGIIAVDPKVIPLGAKIYVPGYGYGIAADVGGAIKGNRIDLGFNSRSGSLKWGKKPVQITLVD